MNSRFLLIFLLFTLLNGILSPLSAFPIPPYPLPPKPARIPFRAPEGTVPLNAIFQAAFLTSQPVNVLWAVCQTESYWRNRSGLAGEQGVCQFRRATWNRLGCLGKPRDPLASLICAGKLLSEAERVCKRWKSLARKVFYYNEGTCSKTRNPQTLHVSRVRNTFQELERWIWRLR